MQVTTKKILLVEDDKDYLWILRQSFANQPDISVVYAVDGEEGLEMAQKEQPDLMMIDINLPKMDGIEMAKAIKAKGIKCLMIFLTNLKDSEHISEAISLGGPADYIVKSDMHLDTIVGMVKEKLGLT